MMYGSDDGHAEAFHQEHAIAQGLVIVNDVEPLAGHQLAQFEVCPHAEGEYVGEEADMHRRNLIEIERRQGLNRAR